MGKGNSKSLKPPAAAREIGCAPGYVRERMRDKGENHWDLGEVVKPKNGGQRHSYYIFRAKLDKLLGELGINAGGEAEGNA